MVKTPGSIYGLIRGIMGGFMGYFYYVLIHYTITSTTPILGPNALLLTTAFKLILLAAPLQLIAKMKYWSTGYLAGFLFGVLTVTKLGLYSMLEAFLYLTIGTLIIFRRAAGS